MPLNKDNVRQAVKLLKMINNKAQIVEIENPDQQMKYLDVNMIYCVGKKNNDSFEKVFMNVFDITQMQMQLWDNHKYALRNALFEEEFQEYELTRIGWC